MSSSIIHAAGLITLCGLSQVATGQSVRITGGFSQKDHVFTYEIENRGTRPLIYVEFPHFHADALVAPDGWSEKSTNLVRAKVPSEPGVCTAQADLQMDGIQPGKKKTFIMRLSLAAADVGKGDAKVRFADGKEEIVHGVEVPVKPPPQGFGLMPPLAIGVVFVLYVLARYKRGRKSVTASTGPGPPRDDVI